MPREGRVYRPPGDWDGPREAPTATAQWKREPVFATGNQQDPPIPNTAVPAQETRKPSLPCSEKRTITPRFPKAETARLRLEGPLPTYPGHPKSSRTPSPIPAPLPRVPEPVSPPAKAPATSRRPIRARPSLGVRAAWQPRVGPSLPLGPGRAWRTCRRQDLSADAPGVPVHPSSSVPARTWCVWGRCVEINAKNQR